MATTEIAQTTLEISLPKPLKDYVESLVGDGSFETPSDFVEALILQDQQALEEKLLKAMDSGFIEISEEELTGGNFIEVLMAKRALMR